MNSATIAINTGAIYELYGVLTGAITSGVTINETQSGIPKNVQRLVIMADPGNGATIVAFGDAKIATDGTTGLRLAATSPPIILQGNPSINLKNKYIATTVNSGKINLFWE